MRIYFSLIATLLGALLLAGCGAAAPALISPAQVAAGSGQVLHLPGGGGSQEDPAALLAPAVPEPADECVACHTDRARLTETADSEAPAESESSGVG